MSILKRKPAWRRLSYVPTWIVGVNYYTAKIKVNEQVVLKPDPNNKADPLAMAIYNHKQQQIGHLPRYDAAIFTPAVNRGEIMLKGTITEITKNWRHPLQLEVYIAPKAEKWLVPAFNDDIKAIHHNNLLNVWNNLEHYSSETIVAFRNSMRDLAHNNKLHYHTAILYRLLRGMVRELQVAELVRYRNLISDNIKHLGYGPQLGSRELTVFPLFESPKAISRYKTPLRLPKELALTPENLIIHYPYPADAIGAVYFCGGELKQFYLYATPAKMQVEWFKLIKNVAHEMAETEQLVKQRNIRKLLLKIFTEVEIEIERDECGIEIFLTTAHDELEGTLAVEHNNLIALAMGPSIYTN